MSTGLKIAIGLIVVAAAIAGAALLLLSGGDDDDEAASGGINLAPVERELSSQFAPGNVDCPNDVQPAPQVRYQCMISGQVKGTISVTQKGPSVQYDGKATGGGVTLESSGTTTVKGARTR